MADVFSKITDTAIMAGWAVLAVIVLRLIFRNTSSRLKCAMWAIVALRLILWFPIETRFAVLPAFSVKQPLNDTFGYCYFKTGAYVVYYGTAASYIRRIT